MNSKLIYIAILLLLAQQAFSLVEKDSNLYQLHRWLFDNQTSYQRSNTGMGWFSAVIISFIAGILCFLGIMYYCKWRRQGTVNVPILGTFGNRGPQVPVNAQYNAPGSYPQQHPTYAANPYGHNNYSQPNQNPYDTKNPQYPAL